MIAADKKLQVEELVQHLKIAHLKCLFVCLFSVLCRLIQCSVWAAV